MKSRLAFYQYPRQIDQDGVIQPEAMVQPAAARHRVLLQRAQARRGLARISDARVRPRDRLHIGPRQGGDAAHPAQQVQRRPLGRQQSPRVGLDRDQNRPCLERLAVRDLDRHRRLRVQRVDGDPHHRPARHHPGLTR